MAFQLSPLSVALWVEGESTSEAVGQFSGHVILAAMQDTDPVAGTITQDPSASTPQPEGIHGWGSTFFLVADPDKPAPVWVAKADVRRHEVRRAV